jgi:hypothetical protein
VAESDSINPQHYKQHGVECIDIVAGMSFCLGNALKYLFRRKGKDDERQNVEKALWYINYEHQLATREVWRTFSADDRYEISSLGNVRRTDTGRIRALTPIGKRRYLTFVTNRDHEAKMYYVHVAVAQTFFCDIPSGFHVCHNDNVTSNNRVTNLRIDTPTGNALDRRLTNTHWIGARNPQARLTAEDATEIRTRTEPESILAEEFNVSMATIGRIRRGESWKETPVIAQHVAINAWLDNENDETIQKAALMVWKFAFNDGANECLTQAAQMLRDWLGHKA